MTIQIKSDKNQIHVYSPYNPEFPAAAKQLGGRWNAAEKCWTFDSRDEQNVRDLCIEIYGTDGTESNLVTVRITANRDLESDYCNGYYMFGRQIARATGRDSGAFPCDGVVVLEGRKFRSGGSRKNWKTIIRQGTIFEVRDVPQQAIDNEGTYELDNGYYTLEYVDSAVDHDALKAERAKLVARIAEIDELLANKKNELEG